jgi:hypothetical protein
MHIANLSLCGWCGRFCGPYQTRCSELPPFFIALGMSPVFAPTFLIAQLFPLDVIMLILMMSWRGFRQLGLPSHCSTLVCPYRFGAFGGGIFNTLRTSAWCIQNSCINFIVYWWIFQHINMLLDVIILFCIDLWGFSIDPPYFGYNPSW